MLGYCWDTYLHGVSAKVLLQPLGKKVSEIKFLLAGGIGSSCLEAPIVRYPPLKPPRSPSKQCSILRRLLLSDCKG